MEPSQAVKDLVAQYELWQKSLQTPEEGSTIHVDEVAMQVASFYEKIRTIIDWKEEHLMRRAAIIRKLKRRFMEINPETFNANEMAEALVLELIRGGYFPNDKILESKIVEVEHIISKYVFILQNSVNPDQSSGLDLYSNLLEIAACEIEETLSTYRREMSLVLFMFSRMMESIHVHEQIYKRGLLTPEERDIQIYIAVQQALFKFDTPMISYNLLKYKYRSWNNPSQDELNQIALNIYQSLNQIHYDLQHPLAKKFYAICEKYDTPYLLLSDILTEQEPSKVMSILSKPDDFELHIRRAYAKRLQNLKGKLSRAAVYATASIFITKILSLVILEVIIAKVFGGAINFIALLADILIPTTLMALMVIFVKPPSKKNLNIAIIETIKVVYPQEKPEIYEVRLSRKRSVAVRTVLSLFYVMGAAVSFGLLYAIFTYFDFSLISIIIDIIFIALVLFAGTAIQKRSQELTIQEESEGVVGFISDILFLPMASLGRWMSNTWKQYNAITAFFNALIDMPFSAFVEFIEGWRYFIKERKEEMR